MAIEATRMEFPLARAMPGYRWWAVRSTRAGVPWIIPAAQEGIIRADEAAIVHAADVAACAAEIAAVRAEDAATLAAAEAAAAATLAASEAAAAETLAASEAAAAETLAASEAAAAATLAAAEAAAAAELEAALAAAAAELDAVRAADAAALEAALLAATARVTGAAALTPTSVRVFFDRVMLDDGALRDPASYVLSAVGGAIARSVVAVDSSASCSLAQVDLTLSGEMTLGVANYVLDVAATVRAANGDLIIADAPSRRATFDGLGLAPELARASSTVDRVRIRFDEAMREDAELTNAANYTITGDTPVTVLAVEVVSSRELDLVVSGHVAGGHYRLAVANVRDLAGNLVI